MSLTYIKLFVNQSFFQVSLQDYDSDTGTGQVAGYALNPAPPNQQLLISNAIPWCNPDQVDQFNNLSKRQMVLTVRSNPQVTFHIYQYNNTAPGGDGDHVRMTLDGRYFENGHLVPGANTTGGNRRITLSGTTNTNISMSLDNF